MNLLEIANGWAAALVSVPLAACAALAAIHFQGAARMLCVSGLTLLLLSRGAGPLFAKHFDAVALTGIAAAFPLVPLVGCIALVAGFVTLAQPVERTAKTHETQGLA